jgi:flagellar hook-basal body complex protein FliE
MNSVGSIGSRPVAGETFETTQPTKIDRPEARGPDFGDALIDAVEGASATEKAATETSQRFAAGDPNVGIHEVIIASEKASIAVRYATTLKNKMLDAYRELMNTQV